MSANSYRNIEGNATAKLVAAGGVTLHRVTIHSNNDEDVFFHLYDAASAGAVTVGTTTPLATEGVPLSDGTNYSIREIYYDEPIELLSGLVWAITKEADAGNTAPDANCLVTLSYR